MVVGAGAAGLLCAATAAARGRRVVVIEHAARAGNKIAISGGGRCNFTNLHTTPADFVSDNPHFCRSALARYTPADFVALVESHGIAWHEKEEGQLFCDGSARQIVAMLLTECARAGAEVVLGCRIEGLERNGTGTGSAAAASDARVPRFVVETGRTTLACRSLVVASGGLSVPALGVSDFGYRLARRLGLGVIEPRPSLVPLTFRAGRFEPFKALAGVSVQAAVSCGRTRFVGPVLMTHRGISGPAILQISSYWTPGAELVLDLLPGARFADVLELHRGSRRELQNLLATLLPRRFALAWAEAHDALGPLRQFTPSRLARIADELHHWRLRPDGSEGFRTAEVTGGGVDTAELSSKTMEARRVPGLYFIGEVVDVTGRLGGFNFQWAWASGRAAGLAA